MHFIVFSIISSVWHLIVLADHVLSLFFFSSSVFIHWTLTTHVACKDQNKFDDGSDHKCNSFRVFIDLFDLGWVLAEHIEFIPVFSSFTWNVLENVGEVSVSFELHNSEDEKEVHAYCSGHSAVEATASFCKRHFDF